MGEEYIKDMKLLVISGINLYEGGLYPFIMIVSMHSLEQA